MPIRLKAASAVALSFFALAAFVASDASVAGEYAALSATHMSANAVSNTVSAALSSTASVLSPTSAPPSGAYEVLAPSAEATQPLPSTDTQTILPPALSDNPASLAALVSSAGGSMNMDEETRCLASAVFFEARSESLSGQLAVAHVVINRARSGRFARSLCGVVKQRGQFSFVRGGVIPAISASSRDWREAAAIAQIALANSWENPVQGALFFHARRVSPGWKLKRVAAIDNHIFYR
mgnify:CR=1 FL=1